MVCLVKKTKIKNLNENATTHFARILVIFLLYFRIIKHLFPAQEVIDPTVADDIVALK